MDGGLVNSAAQMDVPDDRRIYGVAVAEVVKNCDEVHLGRVQVRLSWLPGYEPWARVAVLDQGAYFIPKVGDEVLVAFNHGDVSEAYIVGQLWNSRNHPPAQARDDPVNKRMIRTPQGHEILFDDQAKSITITSADKHQIAVGPTAIKITMAEDKASMTLDTEGQIVIKSKNSIKLNAPNIIIGDPSLTSGVEIASTDHTSINGGSRCNIDAGRIDIG